MSTETDARIRWFKRGLYLCWAGILAVPIGFTQVTPGMCLTGPRTTVGSIFVLALGLLSTVGAVVGIVGVIRGLRTALPGWKIGAGFSALGAGLAIFPGLVLLTAGFFSTLYRFGML
jgi:hypothetical protein